MAVTDGLNHSQRDDHVRANNELQVRAIQDGSGAASIEQPISSIKLCGESKTMFACREFHLTLTSFNMYGRPLTPIAKLIV